MFSSFWKWFFISITIILFLMIGFMAFLFWKNYQINKEKLALKFGAEEERKKKIGELEQKEQEEQELRRAQLEAMKGFRARGKGKVLDRKNVPHNGFLKGPEGITCLDGEGEEIPGTLIYMNEINNHFAKIMSDIIAVKNSDNFNVNGDVLEDEEENDDYSPWLKRNNTLLYGTPGTGKTVFVNELVHHFYQEYGKPLEEQKKLYADQLVKIENQIKEVEAGSGTPEEKLVKTKKLTKLKDEQTEEMLNFVRKNKVPPVIQINGSKLKSAGGLDVNAPNTSEMIVEVIKHEKEVYFGDPYSPEPYIVFFEEADEMGDVMTKKEGNYLKDIKDWLSSSEDKGGLASDAQDPNSVVIGATNHFEKIEPGAVRRGRLGKALNFNWAPEILEEYGEAGGEGQAWPKINWPKSDLGWIFAGNAHYPQIMKLVSEMGYSIFKDKFAEKAIQILEDYNKLKNGEQLKEKAKKELALDVPTGKKVPSGRKRKKSDGTEEDIMEDEMVCNWLLHFLSTFHFYRKENKLELFNSILQLRRYDFGNEYFLREELKHIYNQIGFVGDQLGLVYDAIAKEDGLNQHLGEIKDFMAEAHNVRQEVANLKAAVNDVENYAKKAATDANANTAALKNQITSLMNVNTSSTNSELSSLASRINSLESSISRLANSGGGTASSSGGVSMSEYNSNISKLNRLNSLATNLINAVHRGETNLNSYIDQINSILGS